MKLSILVCHLESRKALLERLLRTFQPQIDAANGEVEILVEADNGQLTTGEKRNRLLERAKGVYCASFDDDDLPSYDYVSRILEAIKTEPDVVGMIGLIYIDPSKPKRFIHSLEVTHWHETPLAYMRNPNHINPVKRELALKTKFKNITVGEDHDYSTRLLPLLKTQVMLSGNPIYFYYP